MQLNSQSSPRDSITLSIEGNQTAVSFSYYHDSRYQWLKWISLPSLSSTAQFHTYTIHYSPDYFSFYAEDTLLALFNTSNVQHGLPSRTMALWFYMTADAQTAHVPDAMYVKSASYELGT